LATPSKTFRGYYDDPGEYQLTIDAALQAVAKEVERIVNLLPSDSVVPMQTQRRRRAR
jgi:hypothetical protein